MTRAERRIFTALVEHAAAPAWPLPPIAETDAIEAFGRYLVASPAVNRLGLRASLALLELAPIALGPVRRRLTRLSPEERNAVLDRLASGRAQGASMALRGLAHISYYGDSGVLATLGYDPTAVVQRGKAVRAAEGRW
jgi:hypothetical protein